MDSKYKYIINPLTGRKVKVTGPTGRKVLKFYLEQQGSGCVLIGKSKGKGKKKKCKWIAKKPTSDDCYCINAEKKKDICQMKSNGKTKQRHEGNIINCDNVSFPDEVDKPKKKKTNKKKTEKKKPANTGAGADIDPAINKLPTGPSGIDSSPYIFNPIAGTIEIRGTGAAGRIVRMDSNEGIDIINRTGYTPEKPLTEEEMRLAEEEFSELDDIIIPLGINIIDSTQKEPEKRFLETDEEYFKRLGKWRRNQQKPKPKPKQTAGEYKMMSFRQLQEKHNGFIPPEVRENHIKYFMSFRHRVAPRVLGLKPTERTSKRWFNHDKTILGPESTHANRLGSQKLYPEVRYLREHLSRGEIPRLDWEGLLPIIREFINEKWSLIANDSYLRNQFYNFYRNLPNKQINLYLAMRYALLNKWKETRGEEDVFPVANHPDEPILCELMRLTRIDQSDPGELKSRSTRTHGGLNSVHGVVMCTGPNKQFYISPDCIYNEDDDNCEVRKSITPYKRNVQMAQWATGEQVAAQREQTRLIENNKKRIAQCKNRALHISRSLLRIPPELGQEFFVRDAVFPDIEAVGEFSANGEAAGIPEGAFEVSLRKKKGREGITGWKGRPILHSDPDPEDISETDRDSFKIIPLKQSRLPPIQQGTDFSGRRARTRDLIKHRDFTLNFPKSLEESDNEEESDYEEETDDEEEWIHTDIAGYIEPKIQEDTGDYEEGNMWAVLDDDFEDYLSSGRADRRITKKQKRKSREYTD